MTLKTKDYSHMREKRNGIIYTNYAKVEHYEQWMLDAQAKLED